ncbi:MAG: acetyl-CoA C-acetyltransferase [Bacteroidetes bacterium]|nr:acetyl-CoA C-acetyltransferase [Bacteroidota bacterium]
MKVNKEVVIVGGARTAFGKFGGSLKNFTATELGVFAVKGAMERSGVKPADIDHTVFGNASQTSADAIYLARHVALKAGVPQEKPALTLNRLCGSGFESIIEGARQILIGESDVVLCGGTESMSQSPFVVRGTRFGVNLGQNVKYEDQLWEALTDPFCGFSMAQTAENLADRLKISRMDCDLYAYLSQMRAKDAILGGRLKEEIVPVELKSRKGIKMFDTDEHPRPETTVEALSTLPPYFKKDGTISAGNASGICDGAAAVIVTTAEKAKAMGWKPLGRLISWGHAGVEPSVMGIGPVPSSKMALKDAGMTIKDINVVEINEAFAPQYLAVEKELGLDREITNVNGGAIALGHPLAASGTRLTLTTLLELRRRKQKVGLASACIGGGQGVAVVVECLS